MVRAHLFISGLVQGVGFRHFTQRKAEGLGLVGWVRNLPAGRQGRSDGRVEAVLEGKKEQIEKMILFCRKGPWMAKVDSVDVKWEEPTGELKTFEVR